MVAVGAHLSPRSWLEAERREGRTPIFLLSQVTGTSLLSFEPQQLRGQPRLTSRIFCRLNYTPTNTVEPSNSARAPRRSTRGPPSDLLQRLGDASCLAVRVAPPVGPRVESLGSDRVGLLGLGLGTGYLWLYMASGPLAVMRRLPSTRPWAGVELPGSRPGR